MRLARLMPHPETSSPFVDEIEVQLDRDGLLLWLRYTVGGDPSAIAWPAPASPGRADDLWRHTCFEVFVATGDGYVEYNLSPSGRWASYRFDGPRMGMRAADEVAAVLGMDGAFDQSALEARIELPPGARRLGLSCVIEDRNGAFSYWALAHPSAKPDFHHPDSFLLELP
ncbi:hypothetical protein SAMN05192570_2227 [Brevundimonas viscosa]|uniref:DOMON-like domain-containing protein n=2 Tax=Brevundimonas viscosa TaxID=871741 RepID=A0A1I6S716_9CAUL|nr:hypothetical protein SAMN05192570_2227 [Brevundimonas viscosa]